MFSQIESNRIEEQSRAAANDFGAHDRSTSVFHANTHALSSPASVFRWWINVCSFSSSSTASFFLFFSIFLFVCFQKRNSSSYLFVKIFYVEEKKVLNWRWKCAKDCEYTNNYLQFHKMQIKSVRSTPKENPVWPKLNVCTTVVNDVVLSKQKPKKINETWWWWWWSNNFFFYPSDDRKRKRNADQHDELNVIKTITRIDHNTR